MSDSDSSTCDSSVDFGCNGNGEITPQFHNTETSERSHNSGLTSPQLSISCVLFRGCCQFRLLFCFHQLFPRAVSTIFSGIVSDLCFVVQILKSNPLPTEAEKTCAEKILENHQLRLAGILRENRANNRAFLTVTEILLNGATLPADNSKDAEPIMHEGVNLMKLFAGSEPSKFGRTLSKHIFGSGKTNKLANTLIAKSKRKSTGIRNPCDQELREKFEGLPEM